MWHVSTRQTFHIQDQQLDMVQKFHYLGGPLTSNDDDWAAMIWNLGKARQRWSMIALVLSREGANPTISARSEILLPEIGSLF
jgi:hypothetical protein